MRLDDVDSLRIQYSCGARLNNCQTPGVKYFCQHSISFVKNINLVANYLQYCSGTKYLATVGMMRNSKRLLDVELLDCGG